MCGFCSGAGAGVCECVGGQVGVSGTLVSSVKQSKTEQSRQSRAEQSRAEGTEAVCPV